MNDVEPAAQLKQQDQQDDPATTMGPFAIALRGLAMGLAELVPGVSGGTIAFVTGIYFRLLDAISAFGFASLRQITQPRAFFRTHDLAFLLALAGGMALGILLFGRLVQFMLTHMAPVLWAFFFGVIVYSAWDIGRARPLAALLRYAPLGMVLSFLVLMIPNAERSAEAWMIFVGGAIAVCAWILPAVSGSFLLLVLGLYDEVIRAVAQLDLVTLVTLAAGCATGLILFARVVTWVMHRAADATLSFLTGFMVVALMRLWPWQLPGTGQDLLASITAPAQYAAATQQDARLPEALLAFLLGVIVLWAFGRYSAK